MSKKTFREEHKATIETLINTSALALSSFGVMQMMGAFEATFIQGCLCLLAGMGLEFFKYKGRAKKLW